MDKEEIYFEKDEDKFKKLSDFLSYIVDDLKNYDKTLQKKSIEKDLEMMNSISKILDGKVLEEFEILKAKINKFLEDPKDIEDIMKECVELKNQLWEL